MKQRPLIGGFPDGSPAEKKPRRRSPSDLRREARRLNERLGTARVERREAWPEGQPQFAAERQEKRLGDLHGEKRGLRRDVYARAPELEGPDFRKQHPGRAA